MYNLQKELNITSDIVCSKKDDKKYYHVSNKTLYINNKEIKSAYHIYDDFIISDDDKYLICCHGSISYIYSINGDSLIFFTTCYSNGLGIIYNDSYLCVRNSRLKKIQLSSLKNEEIMILSVNINCIEIIDENRLALYSIEDRIINVYVLDMITFKMNILYNGYTIYNKVYFDGKGLIITVNEHQCIDLSTNSVIYDGGENTIITIKIHKEWIFIEEANSVKIFDIKTKKILQVLETKKNLAISATGRYLYFYDDSNTLVYEYEDVEEMFGDMKNAAKTK